MRTHTQVHLPKDFEVVDRVKDPLGKQMGIVNVTRGVPSNQEVRLAGDLIAFFHIIDVISESNNIHLRAIGGGHRNGHHKHVQRVY